MLGGSAQHGADRGYESLEHWGGERPPAAVERGEHASTQSGRELQLHAASRAPAIAEVRGLEPGEKRVLADFESRFAQPPLKAAAEFIV